MTAKSGSEALANGRQYASYDTGMCLKWVRDACWHVPSLYASAIDAWNGSAKKHKGDRTPPAGAPCFYSGGTYGHIVISAGGGKVRSTDCTSSYDVSEVDVSWCETHWGKTYLGWTGDLNGVTLPIGDDAGTTTEVDDMNLDDEITEWSPDDGSTGKTTVGKTLNQARGYAEDTYQRLQKVESDVAKILNILQK